MSSKKRPTQADVARLAGVSQTTVSHIINDNQTIIVSAETRKRAWEAIEELGYVPDRTARSLRMNKTFSIATIIPDITNPFYPAFVRGIQDVLESLGYDLIIYNTDGKEERERKCVRSAQQNRVDGLIGVFSHLSIDDLRPLLDQNIAIVKSEVEYTDIGELPLDSFYVDNLAAAHRAVGHLIECGHTRIAMIGGQAAPPRDTRILGYRQALSQHDIAIDESLIQNGNFTEKSGYEKMQNLLQMAHRPSAIFAANDLMAIGALIAIKEAGLVVPNDIAVMGFDDIPAARLITPMLTTIAHFPEELGRRAADLLMERLNGTAPKEGCSVEMPFELIVRESA